MPRKFLWVAVAALATIVGLVALSQVESSAAGSEVAQLVKLIVILLVIGSAVLLGGRLTPKIGYLVVWVAVGLVLVVVYGYRDTFERVLLPARDSAGTAGIARFEAGLGGDFVVEAEIDGVRLPLIVDTGASDVVLTRDDARKLGFDPETMRYTRRYQTANGVVRGAPVTLGEVVVGGIRMGGVRASVNEAEMSRSLLGMSFLGRLDGFEIRNRTLTMYR